MVEGVSRTRDTLISGQLGEYDWEQGYTCHQLGVGAIVVQVKVLNTKFVRKSAKRSVL